MINFLNSEIVKELTWTNLETYASNGLRTLVLTKRNLKFSEYQIWNKKYSEACVSIINREEKMEELQDEIENNLELLGATAIEDKLQDEVGESIKALKEAGINFWVLTGDKIETAINIGYSCKLLNDNLEKIIIDAKNSHEIENMLDEKLEYISNHRKIKEKALIISGDSLVYASKGDLAKKVSIFMKTF